MAFTRSAVSISRRSFNQLHNSASLEEFNTRKLVLEYRPKGHAPHRRPYGRGLRHQLDP
jgi:hypothetical protein